MFALLSLSSRIFLIFQCCLVAFIVLIENRLKQWTVKYGREDHVKTLLDQYNNFVNRNKIFQEFDRAVSRQYEC